ncbi:hypothetical protein [Nocardioides bruguierae]|uniref:Uncharacterized protein n=1 Tax=Nocardioides bruguierae TaxID=2945102 RepID=A0A9X2D5I6_9ACTN|nr:hypothetical protein [Nocardioides bruguierae]MCM0618674.1 hypothetical protein [Nocardioides bruguierae]
MSEDTTNAERPVDLFTPVPGLDLGVRPSSSWRGLVTPRRLLATVVLSVVLVLVYTSGVQGTVTSGYQAMIAVAALLGGLALATYVPDPRASVASSPCATMAAAWVVLPAFVLASPAEPVTALMAIGAAGFGLLQRVRGGACGMAG